ncbi:MAG: hypothetical protein IJS14_11815 [Lentisphaeria bacterium]|nr:hypothetical protein [Lentisphaeria bacterium]
MKFQVLADDAETCNELAENVRGALRRLQMDFPVELEATPGLPAARNAESPVLAENGLIISDGVLLTEDQVMELILSRHPGEIAELQAAAARGKQKARLIKGLLLTAAVVCGVLALVKEINFRREEARREAARVVVLKFTEPMELNFIYRKPRLEADVLREVLLRRAAYETYPDEIKRGLLKFVSRDAAKPEHAEFIRKHAVGELPAVVLCKGDMCRQIVLTKDEAPSAALSGAIDALKSPETAGTGQK